MPSTLKIGPSYCATSNIYASNEGTGRISHSDVSVVGQVDIQMIQFQPLLSVSKKQEKIS